VVGRFDLHSPETVAGVEDEVKGFVLAQGLGDTEAQAGGFVGKCEFPEFAQSLARTATVQGFAVEFGFGVDVSNFVTGERGKHFDS
jgi:hypothetical protein